MALLVSLLARLCTHSAFYCLCLLFTCYLPILCLQFPERENQHIPVCVLMEKKQNCKHGRTCVKFQSSEKRQSLCVELIKPAHKTAPRLINRVLDFWYLSSFTLTASSWTFDWHEGHYLSCGWLAEFVCFAVFHQWKRLESFLWTDCCRLLDLLDQHLWCDHLNIFFFISWLLSPLQRSNFRECFTPRIEIKLVYSFLTDPTFFFPPTLIFVLEINNW